MLHTYELALFSISRSNTHWQMENEKALPFTINISFECIFIHADSRRRKRWEITYTRWLYIPMHIMRDVALSPPQVISIRNGKALEIYKSTEARAHHQPSPLLYPPLCSCRFAQICRARRTLSTAGLSPTHPTKLRHFARRRVPPHNPVASCCVQNVYLRKLWMTRRADLIQISFNVCQTENARGVHFALPAINMVFHMLNVCTHSIFVFRIY